jgi:hypothetical protein
MSDLYYSDVPILINVTLFKNNYYDKKILSLLKQKSMYYREDSKNTLTVSTWDIKQILDENLSDTIQELKSATPMEFSKKINSVYFLYELIETYSNLRYFTINISDDKNCSRLMFPKDLNGQPVINFDFKVIHSVLDFPNHLDSDDLKLLNAFLKDIGLFEIDKFRDGPPYTHVVASYFLDKINSFTSLFEEDSEQIKHYLPIIDVINELLNQKIQLDNPTCLLITDYPK